MTTIEKNAPLWKKTTFHIGGKADVIVYPETVEDLAKWMGKGEISLILGGGSNLLVSDKGIRGVVVSMERWNRDTKISKEADGDILVRVGSGAGLTWLSGMLMKNSVSGLEFGYGIPGAIGGALLMNAGASEGEMKDVVANVTLVTKEGKVEKLNCEECGFGYRSSQFPEGAVITETTLRLKKGAEKKIHEKMRNAYLKRQATQPLDMHSAGSIYKNPQGDYAGRLIEMAGLKGMAVGDAQLSEKHANFIVNLGQAKASEVLKLMGFVEATVLERFNVKLDREVKVVGEF